MADIEAGAGCLRKRRAVKLRRITLALAAIAIAGLLLLFVVRRAGDASRVANVLSLAWDRPGWLVAGVALFSLSLLCGLLRWWTLLRALRLPLRFTDALRLYAAGHFFNVLGPGATGGDLVKGAWVASKCPGRRAEAVASIAAERMIGLLAMIVLVTALSALRADFFAGDAVLAAVGKFVRVACVCAIVSVGVLALTDVRAIVGRLHLREGSFSWRIASAFIRIWETLRFCLVHKKASAGAFAFSFANHCVDMVCYFLLSRALAMDVPAQDLMVISPVSNTIASVPLTPGGAGIREATMQWLLGRADVPADQGAALPLLMFATIVFWAVVCGIVAVSRTNTKRLAH